MLLGNGRGVDDQTRLLLLTSMRNQVDTLFVVDEHALLLQLSGERTWCLVVTGYDKTFLEEVAGNSAHTDAASPYEIYCFNILDIHCFANLITSLAMMSAESGSAILRMFSCRLCSLAAS